MPAALPAQTVSDVLHTATLLLAQASSSPRLDAELLLEHVTGLTRTDFRARPERELPPRAGWSFQQLVKRRLQGEPVAYIRGQQAFWSLVLEVSPVVLIPRPETELVVERALAHLDAERTVQVADLGTGSGAIALAIASERRNVRVTAVDISADALALAQRNAQRLGISNVELVQGSWFAPLAGRMFELLVSNPPYVALDDPALAPEVRRHEPPLALYAGHSGMDAIEHIVAQAPRHLEPGGRLILEHGSMQAARVRERLVRGGFTHVRSHADLAGHERVTEASR